jgi:hypothetical protein
MLNRFHLNRRLNFPVIFFLFLLILLGIVFLVSNVFFEKSKSISDLLVLAVSASAGFVYFLYQQNHQDTVIFFNLFEKFNSRYNKLNEHLCEIYNRSPDLPLEKQQINILIDYFNLCAEEFMFYQAGYVDERAWNAWHQGMKYYSKKPAIMRIWLDELEQGSYYKFSKELILDLEV